MRSQPVDEFVGRTVFDGRIGLHSHLALIHIGHFVENSLHKALDSLVDFVDRMVERGWRGKRHSLLEGIGWSVQLGCL